ncbi:hypothetical protein RHSIM_Rhsim12G0093500 [Rhododendron simsii]|uniref:AP2/ERF domain-containing protein n=1 Tax=Rhododendron simsii TaxID=118357 RepID=A0A834L861_RHOSS|nr:hypothetical protein RHSIM_Rhsim12G0093500 [Rhododendron simsii]
MHVFLRAAMEEEIVSAIEDDLMSETAEDFKWSSPNQPSHERKRRRNGGREFPQKFKGAVPQPNGHCGAQIYANHQRVWLGTFKSETEAAMAYDSVSIKLCTGDNYRNFPWTNMTVHEPKFQSLHSTEATLNMDDEVMEILVWKSSKSFVFTRGWNRFVKEKGLNANDIISFYVCDGQEGAKESQSFYVIEIGHVDGSRNAMVDEGIGQNVDIEVDLSLTLVQNVNLGLFKEEREEFEHGLRSSQEWG